MTKIRPHLFVGARYAFDYYYNLEIKQGGLLDVNRPTGVFAGVKVEWGLLCFSIHGAVFSIQGRAGWLILPIQLIWVKSLAITNTCAMYWMSRISFRPLS